MNSIVVHESTLPPDPVGDALADCYAFLLYRMQGSVVVPNIVPAPETRNPSHDSAGSAQNESVAATTEAETK